MSIQTEIDRIISAVHAAHEKVAEKGGTTAEPYLVANLESAIDSIPEATTEDLSVILAEQERLIATLQETLEGKAGGSGGGSSINELHEFLAGRLEEVDCDEATMVNAYFFYNNPGLENVRLENVTTVGDHNFRNCDNLVEVDLPEVTTIGSYFCHDCDTLTSVNIPKLTALGSYAFQSSPVIERIDLPSVQSIGNYALRYTYALTTLILRYTGGVVSRGSSVLSSSGISQKKGYVYVPAALIEDYKVASGWSTIATQFRAIEDYPDICGEVEA